MWHSEKYASSKKCRPVEVIKHFDRLSKLLVSFSLHVSTIYLYIFFKTFVCFIQILSNNMQLYCSNCLLEFIAKFNRDEHLGLLTPQLLFTHLNWQSVRRFINKICNIPPYSLHTVIRYNSSSCNRCIQAYAIK